MWDCRDIVMALETLHTVAHARSRVLSLSACLVQAANAMPDSSSCLVKGLLGSPHPSILQVLVHKQQHGLLVDPSLPRVPGHPGEPTAAPCSMSLSQAPRWL